MLVCVLNADSPLGAELCRRLGDDALPVLRGEVDLLEGEQVFRLLLRLQPTAVINTAAYSDVEHAEIARDHCFAINAIAVKWMAKACALLHCPLVQISTDHVFAANCGQRRPYRETDPTCPRSVFAHSMRAGEVYAAECPRHFIVRTSALFGHLGPQPDDSNFVETMLRLSHTPAAHTPAALPVSNDQYFSPSYVPHVAEAILHLLKYSEAYGIYHIANFNFTTWFEFAKEIFRQNQIDARLEPVSRSQGGGSDLWPSFSVLDTGKYHRTGGPTMPAWQTALAEYLAVREQLVGAASALDMY